MQVMCALVANDPSKQNWLRSAGLLQVLHRLTLGAQPQGGDDVTDDVSSALGEHVSISVRRQCARILAILSQQQDALVSSLSILLLHLKATSCHCRFMQSFSRDCLVSPLTSMTGSSLPSNSY